MRYLSFTTLVFLFSLVTTSVSSQQMLKNINPYGSSNPGPKTEINGVFYFVATDGTNGYEMWRSNGTPVGTYMVKNINPSGDGLMQNQKIERFGDLLFFVADDGSSGKELWRSDGTEAGTYMIHDINASGDSNPEHLTPANNVLFFSAENDKGRELWKTNIAGGDPELVRDTNPGPANSNPHGLTALGDRVIFAANDGVHGIEIWRTDGTEEGTILLKDINPSGDSHPRSLVVFQNQVFLIAYDGFLKPDDPILKVQDLWSTNGEINGTYRITDFKNFNPYSQEWFSSNGINGELFATKDYVFFTTNDFTGDGSVVRLHKSDGTTTGTEFIPLCDFYCVGGIKHIKNNQLFIVILDEMNWWLYSYDGTKLKNYASCCHYYLMLYYHNGNVYYLGSTDDDRNITLYKSGGNTYIHLNPHLRNPGENWHYYTDNMHFFEFNNELYFRAWTAENGTELWKTDGTPEGTQLVKDINPSSASSNPSDFIVMGGAIYFSADNGTDGNELWKYDPTEQPFATEVVQFKQGTLRNGQKISAIRSNQKNALGKPQENDTYNFVSLGFGGNITLKLGADVYDDGTAEPEILLVETSFGRADQMCFENGKRQYPEMVVVEVSHNGSTWYSLPNSYCRTSFIDIGPAVAKGMPYARYIRLTENSDMHWFNNSADGYDLDGIIIRQDEVLAAQNRLTNAKIATGGTLFDPNFFNKAPDEEREASIEIYPIPVADQLVVDTETENGGLCQFKITDIIGRVVLAQKVLVNPGFHKIELTISDLPYGVYMLQLQLDQQIFQKKFVKQ